MNIQAVNVESGFEIPIPVQKEEGFMKKFLRIFLKVVAITAVVVLLFSIFTYFQGIQYTIALLTGSLRDPYFDHTPYSPEQNCAGAAACDSGAIRILSYNVLCRVCVKDEFDPWSVRIEHLRGLVERYDPDLIGTQELGGWEDIQEFLPEGDVYGTVSFEFGPWTYADSALFYRHAKYELLDSGQFWLSPKPGLPFGFGWLKLSMPRYVCWACLRDRSNGFTFLFLNSHFDNNGVNKKETGQLVHDSFGPHAERLPILFTGDFNINPTTDYYAALQRGGTDTVTFVNAADLVPRLEMQEYVPGSPDPVNTVDFPFFNRAIEHLFVTGPLPATVNRWIMDYNIYGEAQKWASDHPALYVELAFSSEFDDGETDLP
ncbi:MAG: hypothetical protein GX117_15150 [Candidatus Hydrogenedentes bacterium]|jgi:endonuclease/exonuclease/phosphatase family metal-dependent hydrolase|nr:hypothetical protein [Candidatus Hydrogenedentota bacterium]